MTQERTQVINEQIKAVEQALRENNIWVDAVYQYNGLPVIAVEISWGDWKHEHLATDWTVEELGGHKVSTEVTEEDGSDTYSAIHYYIFN